MEQRMAEADATFLAAEARAEKDHVERAKHYDQDRVQARLVLLEEQGILDRPNTFGVGAPALINGSALWRRRNPGDSGSPNAGNGQRPALMRL